jgi:hypothetical protein
MTNQHRATPEQVSMCVYPGDLATDPRKVTVVINALSDRIEALEAAQLEQAESHRFCTDAIVQRVEALEAAQHAHADLSHLSDAEREQVAQELAKPAAWRPLEVETTCGSGDAQRIAQELLKPCAMVVRGSFEHGGKQFSYEAEAMEAERPPHQDKLDRLIALDREDPTPDPTTPEPRPASAEAQGFAILSWSEERQPCEECRYNHCIAETPFGRFLISWKGWEEHPAVTADETPFGDWFECWSSVEEAKSGCQSEYNRRLALVPLPQLQPEPHPASPEAQPAGGLVERVANAIYNVPHDSAAEARAAIREVAAWLRENDSECQMGGDAAATAELLEQEANHG